MPASQGWICSGGLTFGYLTLINLKYKYNILLGNEFAIY